MLEWSLNINFGEGVVKKIKYFCIVAILLHLSLKPIAAQTSPSLEFNEFDIPFNRIGPPTTTMQVTPDNQTLFFRVFESDRRAAIYRTSVSNPSAVQRVSVEANSDSINGTDFSFTINSSGSHLLYRVQAGAQNLFQLYSYNIATRQNIRLSGATTSARSRFLINEAQNEVVFIETELESGAGRLLVAPISGNAPARELSASQTGQTLGTSFLDGDFFIGQASQRVIYYVETDSTDERDLFSVNLTGTPTSLKLNSLANISGEQVHELQLYDNDTHVVYRATDTNSQGNLFSVPVDASSAPRQVSEQQSNSPGVRSNTWFVENQEQRVIYSVGLSSTARLLSSTFETPPSHTRLDSDSNPIARFGLLGQIPQTNQVSFLSESPPESNLTDLYTVDIDGGAATKINDDGSEATRVYFGSNSSFIYTRQQRATATDFQFQLVRYNALTEQNEVLSSVRPYPTTVSVQSILSPNGEFIYLGSNLENENQFDLFQVPLDGASEITRVNQPFPNDHLIDLITIIINDSLIVYRHRGPDGIATPYFVNREINNSSFFVLKAENGNVIVIDL